jgi:phosphoribosyl 1,2-cyclic phosphate phosphodiesterase
MELLLLGTAAADGWPSPFCDCPHCEKARRLGGPNLRSRSGALIDNDLKIDWCPDTLVQMQRTKRSLSGLRTLLFTHQHRDHIEPVELRMLKLPYTQTPLAEPLEVYGNRQVMELLQNNPAHEHMNLHEIEAFEPITTVTGDEVLPLPSAHVEGALLFRITRSGKTIFYGHDSGLYPKETLDALQGGPKLDLVLFDCTHGQREMENLHHMNIKGILAMKEELQNRGVVDASTQLVVTHFSHNGGLCHEDLVRVLLPHGISPAYDGMALTI